MDGGSRKRRLYFDIIVYLMLAGIFVYAMHCLNIFPIFKTPFIPKAHTMFTENTVYILDEYDVVDTNGQFSHIRVNDYIVSVRGILEKPLIGTVEHLSEKETIEECVKYGTQFYGITILSEKHTTKGIVLLCFFALLTVVYTYSIYNSSKSAKSLENIDITTD